MQASRLVTIPLILHALAPTPVWSADEAFQPADFSGLKLGKATISDVRKKLGPPMNEFRDDSGTTWLYYADIGPVRGKVEVIADSATGRIETIDVSANLPLKEAQKIFGSKFKLIRYNFDSCLRKGDAAPVYEAADGPLEYVVYASLGVALSVNGTQVEIINYLSKPLGAKASQCRHTDSGKVAR
jgi:hypothetical protein